MTKRALILGQLIANAYPADTRLLFQRYGISVQPTGKTILDAYLVHGDRFLAELYRIAMQGMKSVSSVDGLEVDKLNAYAAERIATGTAQQAETSGKFWDIFNKAGNVLGTVAGAWDKISGIFSGNQSVDTGTGTADSQLQLELFKLQQEAAAERESAQTKTYLLIGALILVGVLGFIMYQKRK